MPKKEKPQPLSDDELDDVAGGSKARSLISPKARNLVSSVEKQGADVGKTTYEYEYVSTTDGLDLEP